MSHITALPHHIFGLSLSYVHNDAKNVVATAHAPALSFQACASECGMLRLILLPCVSNHNASSFSSTCMR